MDATDFYMFRSYEPGRDGYVTLVANYLPLQDAYGGPNYFTLDPEALYEIHVDNNGDAREDLTFQFRFKNDLAGGEGIKLDVGGKKVAVPLVNVGADQRRRHLEAQRAARPTACKVVRGRPPQRPGPTSTNASGGATTFKKPTDYIGTKTFGQRPATRTTPPPTSTTSTSPAARARAGCSWASARSRSRSTWAPSSTW